MFFSGQNGFRAEVRNEDTVLYSVRNWWSVACEATGGRCRGLQPLYEGLERGGSEMEWTAAITGDHLGFFR